jgi:hypothetical protein
VLDVNGWYGPYVYLLTIALNLATVWMAPPGKGWSGKSGLVDRADLEASRVVDGSAT